MLSLRASLLGAVAALVASAALAVAAWAHPGHGPGGGGPPGQSAHADHGHGAAAPAAAAAASPAPDVQTGSPAATAPAAKVHGNGHAARSQGHGKPQAPRAVQPAVIAAAPAAVTAPAATTAAAAPAPVPAVAAVPTAATPTPTPAAGSAPVAPRTTPAKHRAARLVAVRRRAAARAAATASARPLRTAQPAIAVATVGRHAAKPTAAGKHAPRKHAPRPSSPLVRTVDRVLKVVPGWVAIALAALAGLGLLLGAAALGQTLRARRLGRDRRRLAADVGLLQSALLPAVPSRVGRASVSAAYRPAAGLAAGGDFFDVFELSGGRTAVVLGDMAGHGRDIVPFTALVRYSLRAYLEAGLAPRVALQVASTVLEPQLGGHMVAATVAIYDPDTGRLSYACAGQSPPLLSPGFAPAIMAVSSPPIGAGVVTGRRQTTVGLPVGSAACFCTDGVTDVRVAGGRLGPDGLAARFAQLGPDATADELLRGVVRGSDAQPDDMAVCLLAPLSGASEPETHVLEELELDRELLADGRAARFLAACSVAPDAAGAAVRSAAEVVARHGSAVLAVRRGQTGVTVDVQRPQAAILAAARPARSAAAAA